MKHTPIEPKHIGCGCCSSVGQILSKDKSLDVGFGTVNLMIQLSGSQSINNEYVGGITEYEYTVADLELEYGSMIRQSECATLHFNTPLHDETYEYNNEDKQWYLISQGRGFA